MALRLPRLMHRIGVAAGSAMLMIGGSGQLTMAAPLSSEQIEFFESEVRPVLAGQCYSCHSSEIETPFAGLRLDSREAILKGGDSGPAVLAGGPRREPLDTGLARQARPDAAYRPP